MDRYLLNIISLRPKHISFIMDGNRRYARAQHKNTEEGHKKGAESLLEAIKGARGLNASCVSCYAFSLDNSKRSPEEVAYLMNLAKKTLIDIISYIKLMARYRVFINVSGQIDAPREDIRELIAVASMMGYLLRKESEETISETELLLLDSCYKIIGKYDVKFEEDIDKKILQRYNINNKADLILNVCFFYSSTAEIAEISKYVAHPSKALLNAMLSSTLSGVVLPPVDVLLRTSGETRLSDYHTAQVCLSGSKIVFLSKYWPEMTKRDVIFHCNHRVSVHFDDLTDEETEILKRYEDDRFTKYASIILNTK